VKKIKIKTANQIILCLIYEEMDSEKIDFDLIFLCLTTSDKVYQLLAYGRWFYPGTPASSTAKTGRHDIAEILLKVALNTKKSNQNQSFHYPSLHILDIR
jgi:hypothetical protein